MPSSDLSYRLFLTQRFFYDLIRFSAFHRLGLAIFSSWQVSPPIYGHFTLTYPVFRIWWDTTQPMRYIS